MPPPLRSSANPSSVSPPLGATVREQYNATTPHLSRHVFLPPGSLPHISHSPQSAFSGSSRTLESSGNHVSPTSSSFGLPATSVQMDMTTPYPLESQSVPPFEKTRMIHGYQVTNSKGVVNPDIQARIDKGFFKADENWTCYRRNYFSVACSYTLKPQVDPTAEKLYLYRPSSSTSDVIISLQMCITAKVDGEDNKTIDLVQHTPKRDKGPILAPEKVPLLPHTSGSLAFYPNMPSGMSPNANLSLEYDPLYSTLGSPSQTANQYIANFDRIQFKKATANNGKRRATQQFFHIVVELFAEISRGKSSEKQFIKIATRNSAKMVVRGRSPGHYQDERRGSSTSMGPGGGSSTDSAGPRDPGSAGPSGSSHVTMSGVSFSGASRTGHGGYQAHRQQSPSGNNSLPSSASSSSSSNRGSFADHPVEPILATDEANGIDDNPGYQYYPAPIYEARANGQFVRPHLPSVNGHAYRSNGNDTSDRSERSYSFLPNGSVRLGSNDEASETHAAVTHSRFGSGFAPLHSPTFGTHWHTGSTSSNVQGQRRCARFQGVETSRGYYPETPAL
ncbi:hypothetical protein MMC09_000849 [Bachmanniomyces sp. S44760]|nr:hypothetical protein [Bachmanniomyces sp. S44760]